LEPVLAWQQCALLLMPGRRSRAADFERHDFVAAVRALGLDVDVVAVDAHLGYYLDGNYRTLPQRIQQGKVLPWPDQGGRKLWFVGTSLGSLGSLAYAKRYRVSGLVLLGPYLGEEPLLAEIDRQGGLASWKPTGTVGYDYEVHTWLWLQQYAKPGAQDLPSLYVGYGLRDSYRHASDILAKVLPADHVFVNREGAHDWDTWLSLWKQFLASNGHRLDCAEL
jgi:pimeloyl-ACP methyl ester carboxylesterase